MLYLITGPNGGGKSLKSIELMWEHHERGVKVYAFGYHSLRLSFVDQSLDPRDWKKMPPGSVMFVDEAQKVWRTRRGNAAPPPELQDMEEHRYEGIDIFLISQDPGYLDSHIKGLVSKHWHCIPYGNGKSRVFEFSECQDNPKSMQKRAHAQFEVWKHPKHLYSAYQSAKFHMAKPKIPLAHRLPKLMKWGGLALLAVLVGLLFVDFGDEDAGEAAAAVQAERPSGGFSLFGGSRGARSAPMTAEQYLASMQPRFAAVPSSAPMFDGQQAKQYPRLACMSSGQHGSESCTCLTQQGTRWTLPVKECRRIARFGPAFDPFLEERREQGSAVYSSTPGPEATPALHTGGSTNRMEFGQVAEYGGLGVAP